IRDRGEICSFSKILPRTAGAFVNCRAAPSREASLFRMRRWHSMLTASLSALFAMISVQALSSIWYFSLNSLSEKIFSPFLAQSATNAAPTSLVKEIEAPRRTMVSGLVARVVGGGGSLSIGKKPGVQDFVMGAL